MINIRKADKRGISRTDWLDSRHSFSFADYYDPKHMGFGALRVINEDRIAPGGGFPTHPHRDMEIITYVVEGALQHKDSLGNGSIIRPGEVQRMSAGSGILHSEFNASRSEPVHLLQIWILPAQGGLTPGYEQKPFDLTTGSLTQIAGVESGSASVKIHQDAKLYAGKLTASASLSYAIAAGRRVWVQLVSGELAIADKLMAAGDGAAVANELSLQLGAHDAAHFLLFDLA